MLGVTQTSDYLNDNAIDIHVKVSVPKKRRGQRRMKVCFAKRSVTITPLYLSAAEGQSVYTSRGESYIKPMILFFFEMKPMVLGRTQLETPHRFQFSFSRHILTLISKAQLTMFKLLYLYLHQCGTRGLLTIMQK